MAKPIDYPRASLTNSLQLAQAVDELGGKCSIEMAAEKQNKKVGGSFQALVGATAKFGLVSSKKGQLEVSALYRDHKLAYNEEEADIALTIAFLTPPLFRAIFDRFEGRELPMNHFEKLLIREFNVPEQISSRVSKYFLEGVRQCSLLDVDNKLSARVSSRSATSDSKNEYDDEYYDEGEIETSEEPQKSEINKIIEHSDLKQDVIEEDGKFSVRIKGPGMDSVIVVNEEEDLLIIKAMLKKVEKRLAAAAEADWGDND